MSRKKRSGKKSQQSEGSADSAPDYYDDDDDDIIPHKNNVLTHTSDRGMTYHYKESRVARKNRIESESESLSFNSVSYESDKTWERREMDRFFRDESRYIEGPIDLEFENDNPLLRNNNAGSSESDSDFDPNASGEDEHSSGEDEEGFFVKRKPDHPLDRRGSKDGDNSNDDSNHHGEEDDEDDEEADILNRFSYPFKTTPSSSSSSNNDREKYDPSRRMIGGGLFRNFDQSTAHFILAHQSNLFLLVRSVFMFITPELSKAPEDRVALNLDAFHKNMMILGMWPVTSELETVVDRSQNVKLSYVNFFWKMNRYSPQEQLDVEEEFGNRKDARDEKELRDILNDFNKLRLKMKVVEYGGSVDMNKLANVDGSVLVVDERMRKQFVVSLEDAEFDL